MKNKMVKYVFIVCFVIALLGITAMCVLKICIKVEKNTYERTGTALYNPFIGFAPNADYIDAVGDNRLVYVDVTWRELEPEQGVYDFASIYEENNLGRWRKEGKNVVFRFVCDNPSDEEHMDIPDWLYELTHDGCFYDNEYGRGYSPDYANQSFIEYHSRAIEALGEEFGGDSFFCYIELGSVGHWGEWHVRYDVDKVYENAYDSGETGMGAGIDRLPGWDILSQYVTPYIKAFPKAKLLMRRPFPAVSQMGLGVYNDMTGEPDSTGKWLSWIEDGAVYSEAAEEIELPACPAVWNKAPVGGELTSSISMEDLLVTYGKQTRELIRKSHMSFIGPKCPIACDEEIRYSKEVEGMRQELGYCYGVSESKLTYFKPTGRLKLRLNLCNYGAAPMYFDWTLCVYVLDEAGNVTQRYGIDTDLGQIGAGESGLIEAELYLDRDKYQDIPQLAVGIENPDTGEAEVGLDMKTDTRGFMYIITQSTK